MDAVEHNLLYSAILPDSEFWVQGSGFRVQGSGFRVQGSGFRVQGSGFTSAECIVRRPDGSPRALNAEPPPTTITSS